MSMPLCAGIFNHARRMAMWYDFYANNNQPQIGNYMNLKNIHSQIKSQLRAKYETKGTDSANFVSCRALIITRLYQLVQDYRSNNMEMLTINDEEAIIHLVYQESGTTISSLDQILPSLVVKILAEGIDRVDFSSQPEFSEVEQAMSRWLQENWLDLLHNSSARETLPPLSWSDFPPELFRFRKGI
ncbi:hypothetical protein [Serratia proteamaculans]|uniref:hypothetical protein n=1 Tax=Serratia proteamaculans TaxID=28151 RepID=UPI0021C9F106|nr:hypothetical protein [Serratia proteamaculans]